MCRLVTRALDRLITDERMRGRWVAALPVMTLATTSMVAAVAALAWAWTFRSIRPHGGSSPRTSLLCLTPADRPADAVVQPAAETRLRAQLPWASASPTRSA